jgi:hypothetical protein
VLVGPIGCAGRRPPPVDFADTERSYSPQEYDGVRDRWTRHNKLVRDIGTVIELWGTYKSADFRQAYVAEYGEVYGLAQADRTSLRQAQLEAARAVYEFHVTAQSTSYKWNDFEKKDSPWKLTLIDGDGAELSPRSIEVKRFPEIYEMRFFPARTDFSRTYVVKFARSGGTEGEAKSFVGPGTGRLTLRVAGPLGSTDLTWESAPSR